MADRKAVPVMILLALVILVGAWVVVNSPIFAISQIDVVGNRRLSDGAVTQLSGVELGDNLLRVPVGRLENALRRSPWVADVVVERRWPSTLRLRVVERTTVAWVEDPKGRRLVLAADGTVLEVADSRPTTLPSVGVSDIDLAPGVRYLTAGPTLPVAASFPETLVSRVASVRVGEEGVVLRLRAGGTVLYGAAASLEAKNAALISLLREARRDGLAIDYVDLRIASAPALKPAGTAPPPG